MSPKNTTPIKICLYTYADGSVCGDVSCAKELCPRHYRQNKRGRLGKTKEIDLTQPKKEPTSLTLRPAVVERLDALAERLKQSRSECAESLIERGLELVQQHMARNA